MLANIINRINLFSLVIYMVFAIIIVTRMTHNTDLFFVNFLYIFIYSIVMLTLTSMKSYNESKLIYISVSINLFFMLIYIFLIYNATGLFFHFNNSDSLMYDDFGRWAAEHDLFEGIKNIIKKSRFFYDDMGFIFFISIFYRIIDSPLIIKFVNIFINVISVILIFRISKQFMTEKYAFSAALIFGISSYNIWLLISGLKEPLMILLITLTFYFYYKYTTLNKIKYLIYFSITASSMLFFRIPVFIFLGLTFVSSFILIKSKIFYKILFLIIITFLLVVAYNYYSDVLITYLNRTNPVKDIQDVRLARMSLSLVALSGIFGPFPTIIPFSGSEDVSIYGPSLLFKVFLSPYFLFSIYIALKEKKYIILPLIFFCFIQIFSLVILNQTFKMRYSYLHFPFLITSSLFVIYILNEYKYKYRILRKIITLNHIFLIGFVFLWNYLRT